MAGPSIESLAFEPLSLDGSNYSSWEKDASMHLEAKGLDVTIKDPVSIVAGVTGATGAAGAAGEASAAGATSSIGATLPRTLIASALILLRRHIDTGLRNQYLDKNTPLELWTALKARFDHQRAINLPRALFEWNKLRFQDFKTVAEYNNELFRITTQMRLGGDATSSTDAAMIEKTLSTFHGLNMILATQLHNMQFTSYLILL